MAEAVGVTGGELGAVRANQVLADQGQQVAGHGAACRSRHELSQRRLLEGLAHHAGPLGQAALAGRELIEARGQQGVDGGRD